MRLLCGNGRLWYDIKDTQNECRTGLGQTPFLVDIAAFHGIIGDYA